MYSGKTDLAKHVKPKCGEVLAVIIRITHRGLNALALLLVTSVIGVPIAQPDMWGTSAVKKPSRASRSIKTLLFAAVGPELRQYEFCLLYTSDAADE